MSTPASPETRRYRGAVIGAGGTARQSHLPALLTAAGLRDRVEIVAVVDSAADLPPVDGLPLLSGREQLAALGPLDFIDICTPTASHLDLTLWGLERGYHVVCEKPVALTRAEADRIATAARGRHRIVMPCHQYRFNPVWLRVQEWLREGAIGRWHLGELAVYRLMADPGREASGTTTRPSSTRRRTSAGSQGSLSRSSHRSTGAIRPAPRYPTSTTSDAWRRWSSTPTRPRSAAAGSRSRTACEPQAAGPAVRLR